MRVMVIDRDSLTNQLLASKLEAKGHAVVTYQNKNEAFDVLRAGEFDCVLVDPLPLAEPKPVVVAVWRNITSAVRPYLLLLSKTATGEQAVLAGTNDVLVKPLSADEIEVKMANADRLMEICRHLAGPDDTPATHGMIGRGAFNELFNAATDRAFRYGEKSLIVFIHVSNLDKMPPGAIDHVSEKLTQARRQSDVIGRIGLQDYAIMLQRPQTPMEPVDAFNRFADLLAKFRDGFSDKNAAPAFDLHLVEVPQGAMHAERFVPSEPGA